MIIKEKKTEGGGKTNPGDDIPFSDSIKSDTDTRGAGKKTVRSSDQFR